MPYLTRLLLVGAIGTMIAFELSVASAAELVELRPGLTRIISPGPTVRAVSLGNPNLADVTLINLNTIAITGKGIGSTNVILFNDEGKEFASYQIQVVAGVDFKGGGNVVERHEVTTAHLEKGEWVTRSYLCGPTGCSSMNDIPPISSNPPTGAPPSSTTTRTLQYINSTPGVPFPQSPTTAAPPAAQAGAPPQ